MAEERIPELEDLSTETSKPERQREYRLEKKKKKNGISQNCERITMDTHVMGNPER